ncbi:MAG: hypothetical protein HY917_02105 [Candidatus Diapherotrites archaeon]|nr:hypothetical protein [Candidatus Diapherotrites archaeon]
MKRAMVVLVIAVIVAVAGWMYFSGTQKSVDNEFTKLSSGDEVESDSYVSEQDLQDLNAVEGTDVPPFTTQTVEDCNKEPTPTGKEFCLSAVAYSQNDPNLCETIADPENRDLCYYDLAYYRKTPEFCEGMDTDRGECYRELALKTNDAGLCVKADYEKQACLKAVQTQNYEDCPFGDARPQCFDALEQKKPELCESIQTVMSECYHQLAVQTHNPNLCQNADPTLKDTCYFRIALDTNNTQTCQSMSPETRGNCVSWIAIQTNNPALCEQAGTGRVACLEDTQYLN